MAETLGSLCDKLTIVKLKQWHSSAPERLESLGLQEKQLREEIDEFVVSAAAGKIPLERLTFAANKVYNEAENKLSAVEGTVASLFSQLAEVNCQLWHEVDKGYEITKVPPEEKDGLVKQLALLNLQRNQCIDQIDRTFRDLMADSSDRTQAAEEI